MPRKEKPIVVLDKDMNIIDEYNSIRDFRKKHKLSGKFSSLHLDRLNDNVAFLSGGVIIASKEHYDKDTIVKEGFLYKREKMKEREREKNRKRSEKHIITVNSRTLEPVDVWYGTMTDFAKMHGKGIGNMKSLLSRTPSRVRKQLSENKNYFRNEHIFMYRKDYEDIITLNL